MRTFLAILAAWLLAVSPAAAQLTTLGAGRGAPAAGGGGGATFVGVTVHQITTGTETFALNCGAGCATGDLVIAYIVNNGGGATATLVGSSTALTGLATNSDDTALTNTIHANTLGAADAASPTIQVGGSAVTDYMIAVAIYRGATTAVVKDWQHAAGGGGTTLPFAGFAPSGSTKGVVIFADNLTDGNTVSVSNGTWTPRSNPTSITSNFFNLYLFDQLSGYASGTSTASNFGSGTTKAGYEIEIQ